MAINAKYSQQTVHTRFQDIVIAQVIVLAEIGDHYITIMNIDIKEDTDITKQLADRQSMVNTIQTFETKQLLYLASISQALDWLSATFPEKPVAATKTFSAAQLSHTHPLEFLILLGFVQTHDQELWFREPPSYRIDHEVGQIQHDTMGFVSWTYKPYYTPGKES